MHDPFVIIFSVTEHPGCIGVVARESKFNILHQLEKANTCRQWVIQAVISDYIPLVGSVEDVINREPYNMIHIEDALSIYLHHGGENAVYFDLIPNSNNKLKFIQVIVETNLPSNAFRLARRPLNNLLDRISSAYNLPLQIQRLQLLLPGDCSVLAYEIFLPFNKTLRMNPFGGYSQPLIFEPFEALFREAIISTSPYYKLLCSFRMYDGISWIRNRIRNLCIELGVQIPLPKDPIVNLEELKNLGIHDDFILGIRTANDLFGKITPQRDAVAHFLLKKDNTHVFLSEGNSLLQYSLISSLTLYYANLALTELRTFYDLCLAPKLYRGSILPQLENRHLFNVKDKI